MDFSRPSSARSVARVSASARSSGTTAPSSMAVRKAASMSSGWTRIAGGGRRPIRCSAARTSPMTPRRAVERAPERALARRQGVKPLLDGPDALFGRTGARRRLDQLGLQLRRVAFHLVDLGFETTARFGAGGQRCPRPPSARRPAAPPRPPAPPPSRRAPALGPSVGPPGASVPKAMRPRPRSRAKRLSAERGIGITVSSPMIRVTGENREGPVKLLRQPARGQAGAAR